MPGFYQSPLHDGYRYRRDARALSRYRYLTRPRLWQNAPTEILLNIGSHCTIRSLSRLCCVTQRYNSIFDSELYRRGAEFCKTERRTNKNPCAHAVRFNNIERLKKFLDHGLNPNHVRLTNWQHDKISLLHLAIYNFQARFNIKTKITRLLIERGADVNAPDGRGRTPMHWAAVHAVYFNGSESTWIDLLMENGADINARDNEGNTPLHTAVQADDELATEALIGYGADMGTRNDEGKLPERCAVSLAIRKVLRGHGADI
jgi:ankyrin repeat protein